jgi:hypothetical protein
MLDNPRFLRIYDIGCICCARFQWFKPCQVHHLNLDEHAGQKRLGDDFTIGLCPWHHQGQPLAGLTAKECMLLVGPSMALEPVKFRASFGSDEQLLAFQNHLIERHDRLKVGRRA